jgi:hypothetical protein
MAPGLLPGRRTLSDAGAVVDAWGSVPTSAGMDTAAMLTAPPPVRSTCSCCSAADPLATFPTADLAERGSPVPGTVIASRCCPTHRPRATPTSCCPAAAPTEADGTFTNLEGRVSISEQKVTPPGTARADWMIAAETRPASVRRPRCRVSRDRSGPRWPRVADVSLSSPKRRSPHGRVDGVLLSWGSVRSAHGERNVHPANDAYSLRLVATRRMYDNGTMVQASAASAGLAARCRSDSTRATSKSSASTPALSSR